MRYSAVLYRDEHEMVYVWSRDQADYYKKQGYKVLTEEIY